MRKRRVWGRLLGLGAAVVEEVYCGDEGELVVIPTPWDTGVIAYRDHTTVVDYLEGLIAR